MEMLIAEYIGFAGVTLFVCIWAKEAARLFSLVDEPDGVRSLHAAPTPLVGGLALFAAFVPAAMLMVLDPSTRPVVHVLLLAGLALFAVGFADDRFSLSPFVRLFAFVMILGVIMSVAPAFSVERVWVGFVSDYFLSSPFTPALVCLAAVALIVATNMADGVNGLAPGLIFLWFALLLPKVPGPLIPLMTVLVAASGIVWLFNLRGLLFAGDSGIYLGVGLFALISAIAHKANPHGLPLESLIIWTMLPLMDSVRVVTFRLLQGKSPFAADRGHLHHLLQRFLSPGATTATYLGVVGVPSLLTAAVPAWSLAWLVLAATSSVGLLTIAHHPTWVFALRASVRKTALGQVVHERIAKVARGVTGG